jgi:hypothetical protein
MDLVFAGFLQFNNLQFVDFAYIINTIVGFIFLLLVTILGLSQILIINKAIKHVKDKVYDFPLKVRTLIIDFKQDLNIFAYHYYSIMFI